MKFMKSDSIFRNKLFICSVLLVVALVKYKYDEVSDIESLLTAIKSPGESYLNKSIYIDAINEKYPKVAKENYKLINEVLIEVNAAKQDAELQLAIKKKNEGVKIGMSKSDVLESNWGEPTRVNRSIKSSGESEQWVYDKNHFLYFENGRLDYIPVREIY